MQIFVKTYAVVDLTIYTCVYFS